MTCNLKMFFIYIIQVTICIQLAIVEKRMCLERQVMIYYEVNSSLSSNLNCFMNVKVDLSVSR